MKSFLSPSVLLCFVLAGCDSATVAPTNSDHSAISEMKFNSAFERFVVGSTASKQNESDLKIRVEGERIPLNFFGLDEFDTYEVESEEGEVVGTFSVEVFDPVSGLLEQDGEGEIICVAVETDGHTARLGGFITGSTTHPEAIGTFAVWTVVDHGKGGDKTTDIRGGLPEVAADFHCNVGIPVEAFGSFQFTSGDIEVKVE